MKTGTVDSTIGRIFVTGVSPITLDSMTSGIGAAHPWCNISTNLTLDSRFNEMMGFTSEEMSYLISQVNDIQDEEQTLKTMKQVYDGYMFSKKGKHHIFNPNMALYYLDYMQSFLIPPSEIVDPNIYSDYKKIQNLLNIKPDPAQSDALMEIMKNSCITCKLTASFELSTKFTRDDFALRAFGVYHFCII